MISIVTNDKIGYGFEDDNLRCHECGNITTRYLQIEGTLVCSTCLDRYIQAMQKSLLAVVDKK